MTRLGLNPVQDEDWGAAAELEGSGSKRWREPSATEPADSRTERRAKSHRGQSGRRPRAEGTEEGLAAEGADGTEALRPKSARESHSRGEKESKPHRSDKCGQPLSPETINRSIRSPLPVGCPDQKPAEYPDRKPCSSNLPRHAPAGGICGWHVSDCSHRQCQRIGSWEVGRWASAGDALAVWVPREADQSLELGDQGLVGDQGLGA